MSAPPPRSTRTDTLFPYTALFRSEPSEGSKEKPKRASLPRQLAPADVDLTKALLLLSLPRSIGLHPDTGDTIEAGIGRFGPYLKFDSTYVNLPPDDTVLTIGLNHAVQLIAETGAKKKAGRARSEEHTSDLQSLMRTSYAV